MADWTIKLHDTIIKTFPIKEGQTITIGRGNECDISLDNTAISRQHISISMNSGIYFVSDMGSTNGTFVNGKKIKTDEPVSEKDVIVFGKFTLTPLVHGETALRVAASVSVGAMDLDEETVFVTNKKQPPSTQQFKSKSVGPGLTVIRGEASTKKLPLGGTSSVKIGKDPSCDMVIPGWFVAKAQAYIIKRDTAFILIPQRSWAGTYVNDIKITSEYTLRSGDIITIRGTTLRFE
ncbi:MAG: FHA domain-containing protein [Proteobacteria bacterium]|nr:FHA domain-containing protein [Desulfobulbaceae bacterium]MBU4151968.1 FHA domain-containing protein [Pseudomonadota bacterium]MDP2104963.1 FHA domain-containing protein [Desulfobulbaceae bacterium]